MDIDRNSWQLRKPLSVYINSTNERTFVAPERARHVNHTPAGLGGLRSFLYELDASYERSFVEQYRRISGVFHYLQKIGHNSADMPPKILDCLEN